MSDEYRNAQGTQPMTVYCPQCGKAMRIAPEHIRTAVACPNCQSPLEPWRLAAGTSPRRAGGGTPPPVPPGYAYGAQGAHLYSWRNRWVAGALGVLLGAFGVHRFYLGFTGIGLLQALLTVGSCFILSPAVGIWTFIEGILCFCGAMRDVDGLELRS